MNLRARTGSKGHAGGNVKALIAVKRPDPIYTALARRNLTVNFRIE